MYWIVFKYQITDEFETLIIFPKLTVMKNNSFLWLNLRWIRKQSVYGIFTSSDRGNSPKKTEFRNVHMIFHWSYTVLALEKNFWHHLKWCLSLKLMNKWWSHIYLTIYLPNIYLLSVYLSIHLFIHLSLYLSSYLPSYLPTFACRYQV
jgi:hypothetical protein